MSTVVNLLQEPLVQNALIVGVVISICAALLGVILVLRRLSMMGHALGDIGFFGAALVLALGGSGNALLNTLIPTLVVVVGSFVIMWLSQRKHNGDVIIGMAATGALALGIILTALPRDTNSSLVHSLLFGSPMLLSRRDMLISLSLAAVVLVIFGFCYQRFFAITYDADFARTRGLSVSFYNSLFSLLAALVVAVGMRMMGSLLISCLIIFPTISARLWVKSFRSLMWLSALFALGCFLVGFAVTCVTRIPAGSAIVAAHVALWGFSALCKRFAK